MSSDSALVEVLCAPTVQPVKLPRNPLVPAPPNHFLDTGDESLRHIVFASRSYVPQAKAYVQA